MLKEGYIAVVCIVFLVGLMVCLSLNALVSSSVTISNEYTECDRNINSIVSCFYTYTKLGTFVAFLLILSKITYEKCGSNGVSTEEATMGAAAAIVQMTVLGPT